jgi:hypothetical protein
MGIEFNVVQSPRTANELVFETVGPDRTFPSAEEAFSARFGVYTDVVLARPIEERFASAPQFVGINPFANLRRF